MNITITVNTDDAASKLKEVRNTSPVKDKVAPRVVEMMGLLKKRLDRQSEHIGGSV